MIINILSFSCPLLLAATGALFSEYAGILALFLEGIITFSGFVTFAFTTFTHSLFLGIFSGCLVTVISVFVLSFTVEKFHADYFIAALGINLFFSSLVSLLSSLFFNTRGVLTSADFVFSVKSTEFFSIIVTFFLITAAIIFLKYTKKGIYFRITGSSSDILEVKGINPSVYRIFAWTISAFFAFFSGCILSIRISSFVPNLASGKGWMALAAIFLGRKHPVRIIIAVIIFCTADYFGVNIQNIFPKMPSSVVLSFPYIVALFLTVIPQKNA